MKTIIAGSRGIGVTPNQCDGCNMKAPLNDWKLHVYPDNSKIACTASKYAGQSKDTIPIQWCVKQSGFEITTVISGTAKGVDKLGEFWAEENGINIWRFPADWNQYGKRAGFMRNQDMADVADALIAIWDGESRGTKHMIDIALKANLKVFIYNTKTKTKLWYNELYEG